MNESEAVRFALQLLMSAAEMDSATGGVNPDSNQFATLKVLDSHGVRTVTEAEQRKAFASGSSGAAING